MKKSKQLSFLLLIALYLIQIKNTMACSCCSSDCSSNGCSTNGNLCKQGSNGGICCCKIGYSGLNCASGNYSEYIFIN